MYPKILENFVFGSTDRTYRNFRNKPIETSGWDICSPFEILHPVFPSRCLKYCRNWKNTLGKLAVNSRRHLIRVLNKGSVTDGGNLCPLWLGLSVLSETPYSCNAVGPELWLNCIKVLTIFFFKFYIGCHDFHLKKLEIIRWFLNWCTEQNLVVNKKDFIVLCLGLGRVVQKVENAIHWINYYPAESMACFVNIDTLDSDLSGG